MISIEYNPWTILHRRTTSGTTSNDENEHTKEQSITRKRIFIDKEHPIDDPLDPFTKEIIDTQLSDRIEKKRTQIRELLIYVVLQLFFIAYSSISPFNIKN